MEITQGKIESAQKAVIYGPEGIGKSSLAAMLADPLFIDVEGSTKHLDVKRLPVPESWTMLVAEVTWAALHAECATLVIDTADWAEQLCIAHVCAAHQWGGIEDPGYGKGYTYLVEEFGKLLNLLTDCVEHGMNVVFTAHAQVRKFEQPDEATPYDRWELKLQKKTAAMVKEWADMVLFANYKTFAVKDSKTQKVTGQGGKRVIYTSHTPAWDAKNRHELPAEIPFEDAKELPAELAAAIPAVERKAEPEPVKPSVPLAEAAPQGETAQPASTTEQQPKQAPSHHAGLQPGVNPVEIAPHLIALDQLMQKDGVTEDDVRRIVAEKGYFPKATAIEKYPADFVDGVLVGAWPQVLEAIRGTAQQSLEDAPFYSSREGDTAS